jgi:hypothetical protein
MIGVCGNFLCRCIYKEFHFEDKNESYERAKPLKVSVNVSVNENSHLSGDCKSLILNGVPYGNRTRVAAVKGRCPRPLDERDAKRI